MDVFAETMARKCLNELNSFFVAVGNFYVLEYVMNHIHFVTRIQTLNPQANNSVAATTMIILKPLTFVLISDGFFRISNETSAFQSDKIFF
jgi:hypothetical protein